MKQKILLLCLMIVAGKVDALTYIPCAEDEEGSCWSCGDTCSARLTYSNETDAINQTNATLTFSGNGRMYNYESPSDNPELTGVEPWYGVRDSIKNVVVEEGITHLGNRTVYTMHNLTDVSLPQSLESIGKYAFNADTSLQNLVIPENVITIYASMLGGSTGVQNIYCPENIKAQCEAVLNMYPQWQINLLSYKKDDNELFYNGKWYAHPNDILTGNNIKKRIYTVEEATAVSKKTGNTFKIRYK